ncbi:MAG: hypothetical protein NZ870_01075 [bacterium]|nr:hypothetical protein [bacterium]
MYHLMPVPVGEGSIVDWISLLVWFLPFVAIYIWHVLHDHRHTNSLEKKLDQIIELLRKITK